MSKVGLLDFVCHDSNRYLAAKIQKNPQTALNDLRIPYIDFCCRDTNLL